MKIKKIIEAVSISIIAVIFFCGHNVNANNEIVWEDWKNESYWEWHTRTTTKDNAYNGKHIQIKNEVITFYGYGKTSHKDFLYKEYNNEGTKTFQFIIDESKANYHTLDGAGFIFNADKVEDKLSGYILLFKEKDVCIYRIEDVDVNTFETATNATIETYGKLLETKTKMNSDIHELIVEVTPTNVKITENNTEIINLKLDYSKHVGNDFGLISSYVQHDCRRLSKIEFSELEIKVEDYKITILNTNMQGKSITGGYFEVKDEKGNIIKEGYTDNKGKINLEGIKEGIYTVQQKIAPKTYILNDNIYRFKVSNENKEIEVIVKNEQYKIEINNYILDTEIPIPGSKIALYNSDGELIDTKNTNSDGKVEFTGITNGEYTYKQLSVPDGYILNTNEYKCIVNEDGTVEFDEVDKNIIYNEKIVEEVIEEIEDTTENDTIEEEIIEEVSEEEVIEEEIIEETITDDTRSNIAIPYAGEKAPIIGILIAFSVMFGIGALIKIKKYDEY